MFKGISQVAIRKSWYFYYVVVKMESKIINFFMIFSIIVISIYVCHFAILNFDLRNVQDTDRCRIKVSLSILIPKVLSTVTGEVNLIRRDLTLHLRRRLSLVKG